MSGQSADCEVGGPEAVDLWGSPLTVEAVSAARTVRDCCDSPWTVGELAEPGQSADCSVEDVPSPVGGHVDGREDVGLLHHVPVSGLVPDCCQGPGDDQQHGLHVRDRVRQDGDSEAGPLPHDVLGLVRGELGVALVDLQGGEGG